MSWVVLLQLKTCFSLNIHKPCCFCQMPVLLQMGLEIKFIPCMIYTNISAHFSSNQKQLCIQLGGKGIKTSSRTIQSTSFSEKSNRVWYKKKRKGKKKRVLRTEYTRCNDKKYLDNSVELSMCHAKLFTYCTAEELGRKLIQVRSLAGKRCKAQSPDQAGTDL